MGLNARDNGKTAKSPASAHTRRQSRQVPNPKSIRKVRQKHRQSAQTRPSNGFATTSDAWALSGRCHPSVPPLSDPARSQRQIWHGTVAIPRQLTLRNIRKEQYEASNPPKKCPGGSSAVNLIHGSRAKTKQSKQHAPTCTMANIVKPTSLETQHRPEKN